MEFCQIYETLLFAGGNRGLYELPVFINNGIRSIFPALVYCWLAGSRQILIEAVVISIAPIVEPTECTQSRLDIWPDEILIAGPVPQGGRDESIKTR